MAYIFSYVVYDKLKKWNTNLMQEDEKLKREVKTLKVSVAYGMIFYLISINPQ